MISMRAEHRPHPNSASSYLPLTGKKMSCARAYAASVPSFQIAMSRHFSPIEVKKSLMSARISSDSDHNSGRREIENASASRRDLRPDDRSGT